MKIKLSGIILVFFLLPVLIKGQSYEDYIEQSFNFLEDGNVEAAETALKEALKKEPANAANVMLLANLGTIQRMQGKYEEALVSYTASLSRAPRNTAFLANRASLYAEMGKPENAITDYTSLLLITPDDEESLYERGLLYLQLKNFQQAQEDFEKIIELNPGTVKGRMGIASLAKLKQEYDEAERIYIYLLDRIQDNAELYAGRAELYLLTGKNGRAMSDVNKAISLSPDDPYGYMIRARIKLLQYEKKSALNDIEKAISLGYDEEAAQELLKFAK